MKKKHLTKSDSDEMDGPHIGTDRVYDSDIDSEIDVEMVEHHVNALTVGFDPSTVESDGEEIDVVGLNEDKHKIANEPVIENQIPNAYPLQGNAMFNMSFGNNQLLFPRNVPTISNPLIAFPPMIQGHPGIYFNPAAITGDLQSQEAVSAIENERMLKRRNAELNIKYEIESSSVEEIFLKNQLNQEELPVKTTETKRDMTLKSEISISNKKTAMPKKRRYRKRKCGESPEMKFKLVDDSHTHRPLRNPKRNCRVYCKRCGIELSENESWCKLCQANPYSDDEWD